MVIKTEENMVGYIENQVIVTNQDIDDILCTAFEGGINYWCQYYNCHAPIDTDGKEIPMKVDHNYEYLSRGGSLSIVVRDDHIPDPRTKDNDLISKVRVINKRILLDGLKKYINNYAPPLRSNKRDGKYFYELEVGSLDAGDCDAIIQYACFHNGRYG